VEPNAPPEEKVADTAPGSGRYRDGFLGGDNTPIRTLDEQSEIRTGRGHRCPARRPSDGRVGAASPSTDRAAHRSARAAEPRETLLGGCGLHADVTAGRAASAVVPCCSLLFPARSGALVVWSFEMRLAADHSSGSRLKISRNWRVLFKSSVNGVSRMTVACERVGGNSVAWDRQRHAT
jgi:hypothetical protein